MMVLSALAQQHYEKPLSDKEGSQNGWWLQDGKKMGGGGVSTRSNRWEKEGLMNDSHF